MNKRYKFYVLIMSVGIVLLNLIAWISKSFCDWYIKYIFQIWPNTYGRLTGMFPFSVGEIMILIGIIIVIISVMNGILCVVFRKKENFMKFAKKYFKVILVVILNVCMLMTLNCSLLYHCTPIDPNEKMDLRQYTIDDLEKLYIYIVEQCNLYSAKVDRDDGNYVVYDKDIKEQAKTAMQNIASEYPRLRGYYPDVKDMALSKLMSQAYICGYYFPFSMEANANDMMYITNYPPTYCHELSHLHGYIYEDEANFIGYMACVKSGDDFFAYSGYLSVLPYVFEAYCESIMNIQAEEAAKRIQNIPECRNEVIDDSIFLLEETWDEIQDSAIMDQEVVEDISDAFIDTSLQLNGVSEGFAAYDGVVELLLQYYDGVLY